MNDIKSIWLKEFKNHGNFMYRKNCLPIYKVIYKLRDLNCNHNVYLGKGLECYEIIFFFELEALTGVDFLPLTRHLAVITLQIVDLLRIVTNILKKIQFSFKKPKHKEFFNILLKRQQTVSLKFL